MKTVIRCHIKDQKRLDIMKRTLKSFLDKGFSDIHVMDDSSPMKSEVRRLCKDLGLTYHSAKGQPHVINGLVESFRLAEDGEPLFCCVDDIVLGKGADWVVGQIQSKEIPALVAQNVRWATIGLFACYPRNIRNIYPGTLLWNIDTDILYALTAHIYSPKIMDLAQSTWTIVQGGGLPFPDTCDDIWIAMLAKANNLLCFNSLDDFAQHTGGGARSFDAPAGSSYYESTAFVGE